MHGAYVADAVSDRGGDFSYGDVVIHVTSAPGEAVIRKCARNIDDGFHPIIITTCRRVSVAEGLAESAGIANRLEVWDIEQFLSMNLNEHGLFSCPAVNCSSVSKGVVPLIFIGTIAIW